MQPKNIKILAIIFTALLVVTVFPWVKERTTPRKDATNKFENVSVNFSQFTKENTEKIVVEQGDKKIDLTLKDGVWMINDKEASAEKINILFQNFQSTKIQKEASKNKDNQAKFEVDGEQSTTLTITSNGTDSIFFIGKNGPSFDSFYARQKGIVNVYLASGNLKNTLSLEQTDWIKSEEAETEATPATLEMP